MRSSPELLRPWLPLAALVPLTACQSPPESPSPRAPEGSTRPARENPPSKNPGPVKPAPPSLAVAREHLARGDAEEAQSAFARACAEDPRSAAAFQGFGEASFRLFQAAVADPRRGNALLYLQDAASGYRKATELDATDVVAWVGLSRVHREQGDGAGAAAAAQRARDRVGKDTPKDLRFEVLTELGRARSLEFREALRVKASPVVQAEVYQRAVEAYRSAKALEPSRPDAVLELANLELSRGASSGALEVLCEAVKEQPEEATYHKTLCDTGLRYALLPGLVEIYDVRLAKLQDASPSVAWYAGYVKMREAEGQRLERSFERASSLYDAAKRHYDKSAELNPKFAESVRSSGALILAGQARCRFEEKKLDEAIDLLTASFRQDVAMADVQDGLGVSAKRTSLELGGELFQEGRLEKGAAVFELWLALSKDGADVDWLNNAGLLRRDLGEELTRQGKTAEARACFEKSYEHYAKVAELRPDEPRLVNDAALMLLYHLERDLDKAEVMFRRAIELGGDKLDELGERPEEVEGDAVALAAVEQWDYFAEATGDACQNLALLLWKRQGESSEIRVLFGRAFELDPRGTRGFFKDDVKALPASGPAPKWEKPLR